MDAENSFRPLQQPKPASERDVSPSRVVSPKLGSAQESTNDRGRETGVVEIPLR